MNELDPVTRYYVALSRNRSQLKRFESGPVDTWKSPWKADINSELHNAFVCDPKFAEARAELDAAIAGLTQQQKDKHVFGLTPEQIKTNDYKRALRQVWKGA